METKTLGMKDITPQKKKRSTFTVLVVSCLLNWFACVAIVLYSGGTPDTRFMLGIGRFATYRVLDEDGHIREVDHTEYKRLQAEEGRYFIQYRSSVTEVGPFAYYWLYTHFMVSAILILVTILIGSWLGVKTWTSSDEFMSVSKSRRRKQACLTGESILTPDSRRFTQEKLGLYLALLFLVLLAIFWLLLFLT